jgi:hypothetical protein
MSVTSTPSGQAVRRDFWRPAEGRAATRLREAARARRLPAKVFMVMNGLRII